MKPKLAFAWFLVALALTAVLFVQWRTGSKQKLMLERLQLQVEKLDQQAKTAEAKTKEVEREDLRLRGELRAAEIEASNARMAYEALARLTNNTAAPERIPTASTTPEQPGGGGMGAFLANMMKNPETRKAMEAQQRMGLDMVYGSLFKQLKLSPEDQDKFKDALLSLQMTNMMAAGELFDPSNTNRAALTQKMSEQRAGVEQKIKEVLGDEKFAEYQDYNQTLGDRMVLDQFARQTDVSPEQYDQVLGIIREEKKNMQINLGGQALDQTKDWQKLLQSGEAADQLVQQQEQVNQRVLERASQVLSLEQMEKLRPLITNQAAMMRAGITMARQMFQPSAAPPENPPRPQ